MKVGGDNPAYQLFMLALCIYALVALGAEAVYPQATEVQQLLTYADTAVCGLFFVDFCISLYRAENRWRYFYTWGWLDLLSSIPTLDLARWGRAARIARIVRVLRGIRATRILAGVLLEQRRQSGILAAALLALLLLTLASISILHVETVAASNIRTAEDAIWWALTTITTVGYGDHYPVTTEGRFVAGILMCAGVGLFGMFSGFLASWFVEPDTKQGQQDLDALRQEIRSLRALLEGSTSTSASPSVPPSPSAPASVSTSIPTVPARPVFGERTPQNVASE
jgi:voltage-gated potassium channel